MPKRKRYRLNRITDDDYDNNNNNEDSDDSVFDCEKPYLNKYTSRKKNKINFRYSSCSEGSVNATDEISSVEFERELNIECPKVVLEKLSKSVIDKYSSASSVSSIIENSDTARAFNIFDVSFTNRDDKSSPNDSSFTPLNFQNELLSEPFSNESRREQFYNIKKNTVEKLVPEVSCPIENLSVPFVEKYSCESDTGSTVDDSLRKNEHFSNKRDRLPVNSSSLYHCNHSLSQVVRNNPINLENQNQENYDCDMPKSRKSKKQVISDSVIKKSSENKKQVKINVSTKRRNFRTRSSELSLSVDEKPPDPNGIENSVVSTETLPVDNDDRLRLSENIVCNNEGRDTASKKVTRRSSNEYLVPNQVEIEPPPSRSNLRNKKRQKCDMVLKKNVKRKVLDVVEELIVPAPDIEDLNQHSNLSAFVSSNNSNNCDNNLKSSDSDSTIRSDKNERYKTKRSNKTKRRKNDVLDNNYGNSIKEASFSDNGIIKSSAQNILSVPKFPSSHSRKENAMKEPKANKDISQASELKMKNIAVSQCRESLVKESIFSESSILLKNSESQKNDNTKEPISDEKILQSRISKLPKIPNLRRNRCIKKIITNKCDAVEEANQPSTSKLQKITTLQSTEQSSAKESVSNKANFESPASKLELIYRSQKNECVTVNSTVNVNEVQQSDDCCDDDDTLSLFADTDILNETLHKPSASKEAATRNHFSSERGRMVQDYINKCNFTSANRFEVENEKLRENTSVVAGRKKNESGSKLSARKESAEQNTFFRKTRIFQNCVNQNNITSSIGFESGNGKLRVDNSSSAHDTYRNETGCKSLARKESAERNILSQKTKISENYVNQSNITARKESAERNILSQKTKISENCVNQSNITARKESAERNILSQKPKISENCVNQSSNITSSIRSETGKEKFRVDDSSADCDRNNLQPTLITPPIFKKPDLPLQRYENPFSVINSNIEKNLNESSDEEDSESCFEGVSHCSLNDAALDSDCESPEEVGFSRNILDENKISAERIWKTDCDVNNDVKDASGMVESVNETLSSPHSLCSLVESPKSPALPLPLKSSSSNSSLSSSPSSVSSSSSSSSLSTPPQEEEIRIRSQANGFSSKGDRISTVEISYSSDSDDDRTLKRNLKLTTEKIKNDYAKTSVNFIGKNYSSFSETSQNFKPNVSFAEKRRPISFFCDNNDVKKNVRDSHLPRTVGEGSQNYFNKPVEIEFDAEDAVRKEIFGDSCTRFLEKGCCILKEGCNLAHSVPFEIHRTAIEVERRHPEIVSRIMIQLLNKLIQPPLTLVDSIVKYFVFKKDLDNLVSACKIFVIETKQNKNRRKSFLNDFILILSRDFDYGKDAAISLILERIFMDNRLSHREVSDFLYDCVKPVIIQLDDLWSAIEIITEKPNFYLPTHFLRIILRHCSRSHRIDVKKCKQVLQICNETVPLRFRASLSDQIEEVNRLVCQTELLQNKKQERDSLTDSFVSSLTCIKPTKLIKTNVSNLNRFSEHDSDASTRSTAKLVKPSTTVYNRCLEYDPLATTSGLATALNNQNRFRRKSISSSNLYNCDDFTSSDFKGKALYSVFQQLVREKDFNKILHIVNLVPEEKYLCRLGNMFLEDTKYNVTFCQNFLKCLFESKLSSKKVVKLFATYVSWYVIFKQINFDLWDGAYAIYSEMKRCSLELLEPDLKFQYNHTNFTSARRVVVIGEIYMRVAKHEKCIEVLEANNVLDDPDRWKIHYCEEDVIVRNNFCMFLLKELLDSLNASLACRLFKGLIFSQISGSLQSFHKKIVSTYYQNLVELLVKEELSYELCMLHKDVFRIAQQNQMVILNSLSHIIYRIILIVTLTFEKDNKRYINELLEEFHLIGIYPKYKVSDKIIYVQSIWRLEEVKVLLENHLHEVAFSINPEILRSNKFNEINCFQFQIEETRIPAESPSFLYEGHRNNVEGTVRRVAEALSQLNPPIRVHRSVERPRYLSVELNDLLRHLKRIRFR